MRDAEGLSLKERKFVRAYCAHLSPTLAAREAGYKDGAAGQRLLRSTRIRHAVIREQHAFAELMGLEEATIARELAGIGFSQPDGKPTWDQKINALKLLLAIVRPDTAMPNVAVSQTNFVTPMLGTPPDVMRLIEEAMGRPMTIEHAPSNGQAREDD